MVRVGYPMVWRPSGVRFLDLRESRGRLIQRVQIRDQARVPYIVDYQMIAAGEGWRIDGVSIEKSPRLASHGHGIKRAFFEDSACGADI